MSKAKPPESQQLKTCVLILGMHRSGTSALAGVLGKLGCELPANPMPPSKGNAKGFFESIRVRDLNEDLLASAGSLWDDFTPFPADWNNSPSGRQFMDRAVSVLEEEFGDARLFALKDPRICRLVPFWLDALRRFQCTVRPILTVRNPLEVSHSLYAKKRFSEPLSQMIWLRYALDAERATRGLPRFHTSFEQLMEGWETVAQRAQQSLQMVWPRPITHIEFEVAKFLSDDLRHHKEKSSRALSSILLPDWLRETYEILNAWAQTGEDAADHVRLDRIKSEFDIASQAFARLVRAERDASIEPHREAQQLLETNTALQAQLDSVAADAKEREAASASERQALEDAQAALEQALQDQRLASAAEREEFQAKLDALSAAAEQEICELKKLLQQQRRDTTLAKAEVHQLQEARDEQELQLQQVRAEAAASRARRKEMARVIGNREAKIAALELKIAHSTISWKAKEFLRRIQQIARRPFRRKSNSKAGLAA